MRQLGRYILFMVSLVTNRERFKVYLPQIVDEMKYIGVDSVFIVLVVSMFLGAVGTVQSAFNLVNPTVPKFIVGTVVRAMSVLELSPTIIPLVLAGKVGSHIASQLGAMRISEQIDALEVMGINSASYLALPKIVAAIIMFPILVTISMFVMIFSGLLAGSYLNLLTENEFIFGLRYGFRPDYIWFGLTKCTVFGFIIASISSFKGYFTTGGSYEVGLISTQTVTVNSIAVLVADFLLAKLLL